MDHLNRLTELFRQFPGIGPRQAKRFVYFLLSTSEGYRTSLAKEITELSSRVTVCSSCYRFFDRKNSTSVFCSVCADEHRDYSSLMVVAKDVDLDAIEKSKVYTGFYFVLGNILSLVEKDPASMIRTKELVATIEKRASSKNNAGLKEIILALSLNSEGEHTREFVENLISPITKKYGIKISILGRGLSTGTELEYSDTETIKNALAGRKEEILL